MRIDAALARPPDDDWVFRFDMMFPLLLRFTFSLLTCVVCMINPAQLHVGGDDQRTMECFRALRAYFGREKRGVPTRNLFWF